MGNIEDGRPFAPLIRLVNGKDETKWVILKGKAFQDSAKEWNRLIGSFVNITSLISENNSISNANKEQQDHILKTQYRVKTRKFKI